ncbi:MAG: branched-chain amino acid ABC transporter permease [Bacillota bacterium]
MGRFGIISLGHGAFFGIGVYTTAILFNLYNISPWLGMLAGGLAAAAIAVVLGYSCFKFGVIGHYFAIATLVLAEIITLVIIALRDTLETGGKLGLTVRSLGTSPLFFQFENQLIFYYITLALLGLALLIWKKIDDSKVQRALKAVGEDEEAALSLGIDVVKYKTTMFAISAFMTALGGTAYIQFTMFADPTTCTGVGLSLGIVFKAIIGGMFTLWGPTIGSALIVVLEEYTRLALGSAFVSYSQIIYGLLIIILIRFLPGGLHGTLSDLFRQKREREVQVLLSGRQLADPHE